MYPYNYLPYNSVPLRGGIHLGRLAGKSINWSNIFNNANKVLNLANQAIPLVKQVGPMIGNMKSMIKIASAFKDETEHKIVKKNDIVIPRKEKQYPNNPNYFIN